jgi:hypothetical protein
VGWVPFHAFFLCSKILRARKFWSGVPFHAFFLCSLGVAYVLQKFQGAFGSATVVQVLERENSVAVVNNLRSAPVVTSVCQKFKTNGSADKLLIGPDCTP